MTDSEKIIEWVKKSEGTIVPFSAPDGLTFGVAFTAENLDCFVKIIQADAFEQTAVVCEAEAEMYRSVGSIGAAGNLLNTAGAGRALKEK